MGFAATPPIVRFMRKVDKQDNGCWLWTGIHAGTKSRYGYFQAATRNEINKVLAHRWIYEFHKGPIPDGMQVDHLCRVASCVNPDHLEAVTPEENMIRARLKTCRSGRHRITDDNSRWDSKGRRRGCLACWNEAQARRERAWS